MPGAALATHVHVVRDDPVHAPHSDKIVHSPDHGSTAGKRTAFYETLFGERQEVRVPHY